MIINEDIHHTNLDITYHFEKSPCNSKYLLVIFSGFNRIEATPQKTYNYIRALNGVNHNKLFILDSYGPRGCYYLGENMSFEVETSVVSLISKISTMYDIPNKNIITVGSSKGGSAALYFGMKYYYGHVIAGAPQTKIADYILNTAKETTDYMLGTDESVKDSNVQRLNNIIFKQLVHNHHTKIHLFSSKNDFQYKTHVAPLIELINTCKISADVVINNDMENHGEVGKFFPDFLEQKLLEITCGVTFDENEVKINGKTVKGEFDVYKVKSHDGTFFKSQNQVKAGFRQKIKSKWYGKILVKIYHVFKKPNK